VLNPLYFIKVEMNVLCIPSCNNWQQFYFNSINFSLTITFNFLKVHTGQNIIQSES